jgi:hypothetical protein
MMKKAYKYGDASKEDYAAALRGHQTAVDATKSEQREEAYTFHNLPPEEQMRWVYSSRHRIQVTATPNE